ncbi:hypothetical protein ACM257_17575 [Alteromonas macleodii]|uniref:hypothetical protein n=1 Tax=Alteromonas macleodii TaxID=28108 RepID=UPI0039F72824
MDTRSFKERIAERDNEDKLLNVIDSDINNHRNIEQVPSSIFTRMSAIKAKAQAARERRELLEG